MDYLICFMKPKQLHGYSDGTHRHEISNTTLCAQKYSVTFHNKMRYQLQWFNNLFFQLFIFNNSLLFLLWNDTLFLGNAGTLSSPRQKVDEYGLLVGQY